MSVFFNRPPIDLRGASFEPPSPFSPSAAARMAPMREVVRKMLLSKLSPSAREKLKAPRQQAKKTAGGGVAGAINPNFQTLRPQGSTTKKRLLGE